MISTQMLVVIAVVGMVVLVTNMRSNWGLAGLVVAFCAVAALAFRFL